jgi:MFS family permease
VLQIFFILIGGVLGDLHGRRRWWLIGLGGYIFSGVLLMLTFSTGGHIFARFLAVAFSALAMPFALATINATYKADDRAIAIAVFVIVNAVAIQIAWVQGQFLFGWFGWRSTYLIPVAMAILAVIWIRREIVETQSGQQRRLDMLVQSGWTLLVLAVVYALAVMPIADELWGIVVGSSVLIALLGATLVFAWTRRAPSQVLSHRAYRVRDLTVLIITGAIISFILVGFGLRTISLFQVTRSIGPVVAVIALAPILFGSIAALYLFLRPMGRFQARVVIAAGMLLMAASMAGMALVPADGPYLLISVPLFFFGAGYLVASTVWTSSFLRTAVARHYGLTAAITGATNMIGIAIGAAVTSTIFAKLGFELYVQRLIDANVDVVEGITQLTGFMNLVQTDLTEIGTAAEDLSYELLVQYREVYALAYSQVMWLLVVFCVVTALIIGFGLRKSLQAHILPPTDDETQLAE